MLRKDMFRPQPKTVAIVGAGLAGAACASAFARVGYQVTVYEQAESVAAGASGVPLALFAPSVSADDAPHSRMLRRGVHILLDELQRLTALGQLVEGVDWAMTGARERCLRTEKRLPMRWQNPADSVELQSRMMGEREIFHGAAGWVNPRCLINAWLNEQQVNCWIEVKTHARIESIFDLKSDIVIMACGYQTPELLPSLKTTLQPIRGQVEWGEVDESLPAPLKTHPFNGMGHWITSPDMWLVGATFQRNELDLLPRIKDIDMNFEKLAALLPELNAAVLHQLRNKAHSWVGIRTAQKNRQPLMVQPDAQQYPHLWICTGLGSRGLSLAMLCANELLQIMTHSVLH